jgi:hypothetical protein
MVRLAKDTTRDPRNDTHALNRDLFIAIFTVNTAREIKNACHLRVSRYLDWKTGKAPNSSAQVNRHPVTVRGGSTDQPAD